MDEPFDDAEAIRRFGEELKELRLTAGSPPLREIGKRCPTQLPAVGTLQKLFAGDGKRPPRWDLVREVVAALVAYAGEHDRRLAHEQADLAWWRGRHEELERALSSSTASRSTRRTALLGELGRLLRTDGPVPTIGALTTRESDAWRGFPDLGGADYVPRPDVDEELSQALRPAGEPYPFLLVYGDDGAGKSSSAWQAVAAVLDPATEVLAPRDGKALAGLARAADLRTVVGTPVLIWADDLSAADLNELTRDTLARLSGFALVVATISAVSCAEILDAANQRTLSVAKAAFRRAYLVHVPFDAGLFEPPVPADEAYEADVDIDMLRVRLNIARSACPAALAIVRTAIDCRRAGLNRWLTDDILKRLFPHYLAEINDLAPSDTQYERGLEWAVGTGSPDDALLRPMPHRGPDRRAWGVPRALVESESARPVPDYLWAELIDLATPQECDRIGYFAGKSGAMFYAAEAHGKAATVPELAERAGAMRAAALHELGDRQASRDVYTAVYEAASREGAADEASMMAHQLGTLANQDGDDHAAVEWWTRAVELDGRWSLNARVALGVHYAATGEHDEAIETLDRDFSGADPVTALRALTVLAHLRPDRDILDRAIDGWHHRIELGDDAVRDVDRDMLDELIRIRHGVDAEPEPAHDPVEAALAPARARRAAGDQRGALESFRELSTMDESGLRAAALYELGATAASLGLTAQARAAYEESVACGDPTYSVTAALDLGMLFDDTGDRAGALAAWTVAARLGDPATASKANLNIGLLHHESGDDEAAVAAFRLAEATDDTSRRARAVLLLAEADERLGADAVTVDGHYRRAIDAGDEDLSPLAAVALGGRIYGRHGATDEAVSLLRLGVASTNVEARAKGGFALGRLLEDRGEPAAAVEALQTAIGAHHPEFSVAAQSMLGQIYATLEKREPAMRHLKAALDAGHPEYSTEAAFYIGVMDQWDGKFKNAALMFRRVFEQRESRYWTGAGVHLGMVLADDGQEDAAIAVWRVVAATDHPRDARWAREKLAEHGC